LNATDRDFLCLNKNDGYILRSNCKVLPNKARSKSPVTLNKRRSPIKNINTVDRVLNNSDINTKIDIDNQKKKLKNDDDNEKGNVID